MSKLIALVATAVMLQGQRTVIQPGQEVPDLPAHDRQALLAAGAIEDVAASLQAEVSQAEADAKALAEFEAARKSVQAELASTQTDSGDTPGAVKPAARKAGK